MIAPGRRIRPIVDGGQEGHLGAGRFSGELRGSHRLYNAPRVDQLAWRIELLDAVQEERPLLGEEERRSGIEDELPCVGLDLREVWMERAVEREIFRHPPTHVAANDWPRRGI